MTSPSKCPANDGMKGRHSHPTAEMRPANDLEAPSEKRTDHPPSASGAADSIATLKRKCPRRSKWAA